MSPSIVRAVDGPVMLLTIDRPDKKNALTDAMYAALTEGLHAAATDTHIRVVLITGAGGAFSAGNDIADFVAVATGSQASADRHVHRFLAALSTFSKPLVAAVAGVAVGVGTTMLLHCDHVILADSARLSVPFVNLGLVPEAGSSLLLPARIGHPRAFAMFALGEAVDAATAVAWGLANRVVADARLMDEALAVSKAIAARPPDALAATKRLMRDEAAITAQIAAERESFEACLRSPEARTILQAFADRRKGSA